MRKLRTISGVGNALQERATNSLDALLCHPEEEVRLKALDVFAKLSDIAAKIEIARMKQKVVDVPKSGHKPVEPVQFPLRDKA